MCKVSVYDAKTNLSKYLELLEKGVEQEIVITRYDKKIAVILPYQETNTKKRLGAGKDVLPILPFDLDNEDINQEIEEEFGL